MSEGNNISFKPFAKLRLTSRLKKSSCLVYENLADTIDYIEFLKYFRLPDTFESWFLAIAVHVWMTIVVTITEKQGRYFRNGLLESMWQDVEERMNQLNKHGLKSSVKKANLRELTDKFKAAIIAYDEGILSTDMVLAGAVWRMFFGFKDVDPRLLEDMVFYIRRQIAHLDSLHMESLLKEAEISFLPLNQILEEKKSKT